MVAGADMGAHAPSARTPSARTPSARRAGRPGAMSGHADIAAIRAIAEAVRDPELQVVTLGDLGVVRDIRQESGQTVVDITPTYSACPASLAIELAVETALARAGYRARVRRVLAPAWTTDWISGLGRAKLKASGIAPPLKASGAGDMAYFAQPKIACPRCESLDTVQISAFGATACKAQHRCNGCLEPFDYFKCI